MRRRVSLDQQLFLKEYNFTVNDTINPKSEPELTVRFECVLFPLCNNHLPTTGVLVRLDVYANVQEATVRQLSTCHVHTPSLCAISGELFPLRWGGIFFSSARTVPLPGSYLL